jgi:hypothetical protein
MSGYKFKVTKEICKSFQDCNLVNTEKSQKAWRFMNLFSTSERAPGQTLKNEILSCLFLTSVGPSGEKSHYGGGVLGHVIQTHF